MGFTMPQRLLMLVAFANMVTTVTGSCFSGCFDLFARRRSGCEKDESAAPVQVPAVPAETLLAKRISGSLLDQGAKGPVKEPPGEIVEKKADYKIVRFENEKLTKVLGGEKMKEAMGKGDTLGRPRHVGAELYNSNIEIRAFRKQLPEFLESRVPVQCVLRNDPGGVTSSSHDMHVDASFSSPTGVMLRFVGTVWTNAEDPGRGVTRYVPSVTFRTSGTDHTGAVSAAWRPYRLRTEGVSAAWRGYQQRNPRAKQTLVKTVPVGSMVAFFGIDDISKQDSHDLTALVHAGPESSDLSHRLLYLIDFYLQDDAEIRQTKEWLNDNQGQVTTDSVSEAANGDNPC